MEARLSARERGYDRRWDRASVAYRHLHPLCIGCGAMGWIEPATVVDHIEPHQGNQTRFWDEANWQPCCDWHHNAVKAQLERLWYQGHLEHADLRLDSAKAMEIAKAIPRKPSQIGLDGWPNG